MMERVLATISRIVDRITLPVFGVALLLAIISAILHLTVGLPLGGFEPLAILALGWIALITLSWGSYWFVRRFKLWWLFNPMMICGAVCGVFFMWGIEQLLSERAERWNGLVFVIVFANIWVSVAWTQRKVKTKDEEASP